MSPMSLRSSLLSVPLFPLLALLVACEASPKVWVEDSQEFVIPAAGIQSVWVRTHNGSIRSVGREEPKEAKVIARIRAGGRDDADARACLAAIHLRVEKDEGVLKAGYDFDEKPGWQAQVAFEIEQPAQASLDAETHNGAIRAKALRADLQVLSHNGAIEVQDCRGAWDLGTHNGAIAASGRSEKIKVETHNGAVSCRWVEGGPISGQILTHNGAIDLSLAKGCSARLRCGTSNGRIQNSLPLAEVRTDRHSLRGTLGQGEGELRVDTNNGNIRLRTTEKQ